MIKKNYYFLVAGLPDLALDQGKLVYGTAFFREELKSQLPEADYRLFELLLLPEDNRNLLSLIRKENKSLTTSGVYSPDVLAEAVKEPGRLRPYMNRFIEGVLAENRVFPELSLENELTALYYEEMTGTRNEFLKGWFTFELNLRNVMVVLSARRHNLPVEHQVIGNGTIAETIRKSNARDLGIGSEWHYIEKVVQIAESEDILAREKAADLLRWSFLDELNTFNYFSLEVLIAYFLKLSMIERWLQLDPATGEEMFRRLLDTLKKSYEFPTEFSIKDGRK
jgi:hypothetical protein